MFYTAVYCKNTNILNGPFQSSPTRLLQCKHIKMALLVSCGGAVKEVWVKGTFVSMSRGKPLRCRVVYLDPTSKITGSVPCATSTQTSGLGLERGFGFCTAATTKPTTSVDLIPLLLPPCGSVDPQQSSCLWKTIDCSCWCFSHL